MIPDNIPNLQKFQIVIIYLVVCTFVLEDGLFAGIISTSPSPAPSNVNGEVVPSNVVVVEGNDLQLNCTLIDYNATSLDSSRLYFILASVTIPPEFYHQLTKKTLQLRIPNVGSNYSGSYWCYMNDSELTGSNLDTRIGGTTVDIGQTVTIDNVTVVSDNFNNMTVDWCVAMGSQFSFNSTLYWRIQNSSFEGVCPVWNGSRNCSCVFCARDPSGVCIGHDQTFHMYQLYSINITVFNRYGFTHVPLEVFAAPEIVKPRPVNNLQASSLSSTVAMVSWSYPADLNPKFFNLTFQMSVSSRRGGNYTKDVDLNVSYLLTELEPYTVYKVAVRSKPLVEGYWSDERTVEFGTDEDAPSVAPTVPMGFFRSSKSTSCPSAEESSCHIVTIFWQLIEEDYRNGIVNGYRLSVDNSTDYDVTDGNATSTDIFLADGVGHVVRLVAYTSAGDSPEQYIYFPPNFYDLNGVLDQSIYAEKSFDQMTVFFSWDLNESVDNYTLMYCIGSVSVSNRCSSPPMNLTLSQTATNFTFSNIDPNYVYSMSSNFKNGTSGLTTDWFCLYDYLGAASTAKIVSISNRSETSVQVQWLPLVCSTDNRGRILEYVLTYCRLDTDDDVYSNFTETTILLPSNTTEYVIVNLTTSVRYILTLTGVARIGSGRPTSVEFLTMVPVKTNDSNVIIIIACVVSVVGVLVIVLIVFVAIRFRNWFNQKINVTTPAKHEANGFSSASSVDYYTPLPDVENGGIHHHHYESSIKDEGNNCNGSASTYVASSSQSNGSIQEYARAIPNEEERGTSTAGFDMQQSDTGNEDKKAHENDRQLGTITAEFDMQRRTSASDQQLGTGVAEIDMQRRTSASDQQLGTSAAEIDMQRRTGTGMDENDQQLGTSPAESDARRGTSNGKDDNEVGENGFVALPFERCNVVEPLEKHFDVDDNNSDSYSSDCDSNDGYKTAKQISSFMHLAEPAKTFTDLDSFKLEECSNFKLTDQTKTTHSNTVQ